MQIIEISEPGESEENNDEIVVGIDFGTTNSLIAISNNHSPKIIKTTDDLELIPSIITIDATTSGRFIIGKKNYQNTNNELSETIFSIKRLLAKTKTEILEDPALANIIPNLAKSNSEIPKLTFFGQEYSLPFLASQIFIYLKEQAELSLGTKINKAVVSVPAYFNAKARGQILLAAKMAGIQVLRLIAEPTAAAYAYGLNRKNNEGSYLIYDLGGGTFDISILNMQKGILQVIATGGDNQLGGDDFDRLYAEFIAQKFGLNLSREIIENAKNAKEALSLQNEFQIEINNKTILLTRKDLEELIMPLIDKTIKIAEDTLFEAEDIALDGIILVGGATRIPLISNKLKEKFNIEILSDIDPDKAVALGAAMQAENLTSNPNTLLLDVVPLSLGIELYGGIMEKIIMRNTPIPFAATKNFTTQIDNQTGMQFHILQGEREMAKDCQSLGKFELKDIPAMKASKAKIELTFAIDADGILSITACETSSGQLENIEIKPTSHLNDEEINQELMNAFQNATNDHESRLLIETKLDAEKLINGIKGALKESPDILSQVELEKLQNAINSLQNVINLDNRDIILTEMTLINQLAKDFIQKHLNKGAEMLIKGRHINDILEK